MSIIKDMPDKIRNVITDNGWECGGCNLRCSGGFAFELDGNSYNKCHCGSFVFNDLSGEDIFYYESLINKELYSTA